MEANNLFTSLQSGFRQSDSCTCQLLSIAHEIYKSLDCNPSLEVRGIFLDLSKAFDKVWYDGLLYKLNRLGIGNNLLLLLKDYLTNRQQRVLLNGQTSRWMPLCSGVHQGSILGPLLFLIYINDLPDSIISISRLFADDTSLFSVIEDDFKTTEILQKDLTTISKWAHQWKMEFNPDPLKPAQEVIFSRKRNKNNHLPLYYNNIQINESDMQKHLGLHLDKRLDFNLHIDIKSKIINKGIASIRKLRAFLPREALLTIYKSFLRPHLDYADIVYDQPMNETFCNKVESIQYQACLAITGAIQGTSREKLYNELGLESLLDRRWCRKLCAFYSIINSDKPKYLFDTTPI